MAEFGLFKTVHPEYLTPTTLIEAVLEELNSENNHLSAVSHLNLNALPSIEKKIYKLLSSKSPRRQVHAVRELEVLFEKHLAENVSQILFRSA